MKPPETETLYSSEHAPSTVPETPPGALEWAELGAVVEGLAFSQRPIRAAASQITQRYNLGPRGAFILSLVSGGITYPLDLAKALKVGRSLITAELDRLRDAGLLTATPGKEDKRRSRLALTQLGENACREVRSAMAAIVTRNLGGYSPDDIRLFARMLRDVRRLEGDEEHNNC